MLDDSLFIKIIQDGIDVYSLNPYKDLANKYGVSEADIVEKIKEFQSKNKIKRFGPVVSNRKIGLVHNAMVTLKIPNDRIDNVGEIVSSFDFVTLCYQRKTIPDVWEYNLYFMVHGSDRDVVQAQIAEVISRISIMQGDYQILFSRRCFKQKGASYEK